MRISGLLFWFVLLFRSVRTRDLPMCKETDYHYEYTECDVLGSRWRVAVPNKPETCTGLPDPVKGTQCSFSCQAGQFLDMESQQCHNCSAGTYSLGTGVRFDEWETLPSGFIIYGSQLNMGNMQTNCSNSTWIPKGDYMASNSDECTSTLTYTVNLKQAGSVSFQYLYPDRSIFFQFYVQNDQCQASDSQSRWMKVTENDWETLYAELSRGNNVLYWRTTGYALGSSSVKPVLLRNIAITGVSYTSECFHCKPGTFSNTPGSAHCSVCPVNTFSNKGATACQPCEESQYAAFGSAHCHPRPPCTDSDYFYTHTPCDAQGQTQLMYKWVEPKVCSESAEDSVKLPPSGEFMSCPPCNPGFYKTNSTNSSSCQPCPPDSYSNGTVCTPCPAGTQPVLGLEYKWWNQIPGNLQSSAYSGAYDESSRNTAWEVAGEYIYTTAGELDSDYMVLTLSLPGYSSYSLLGADPVSREFSRITFVFETKCTADCTLYFSAGSSKFSSYVVEHWGGSREKQSYSYVISSNDTLSFSWTFQRTQEYSQVRQYSGDFAKIYWLHITNVLGGVASGCRHCALGVTQRGQVCVPCPAGHYMRKGTGVCVRCPPGSIVRAEQPVGKEACVPCGPNTHSSQDFTACVSDCKLILPESRYDFSFLSNVTHTRSSSRFTSKGLRYFHQFTISLCGEQGRFGAVCYENVSESRRRVQSHVCQATVVPADVREQRVVSSQAVSMGDTLMGVTTESALGDITSPVEYFPTDSGLPDIIFYYRSKEATQACMNGRTTTIRLRCDSSAPAQDQLHLPSNCSEGTCDGCSFHFLWKSQHACPLCSAKHYRKIQSSCSNGIQRTTYVWQEPLQCSGGVSLPAQTVSTCVTLDFWLRFGVSAGVVTALLLVLLSCYFYKRTQRLEYKYSKLMMSTGERECELPAADSCAIMEGDDAEDDLIYLTKKSIFGKIKSFSRERTSDGFDSVPLKSSSGTELEMN